MSEKGSELYFCETNSGEFLETEQRAGGRETTKDPAVVIWRDIMM